MAMVIMAGIMKAGRRVPQRESFRPLKAEVLVLKVGFDKPSDLKAISSFRSKVTPIMDLKGPGSRKK